MEKKVRFYQASTSELYGKVQEIPQKETTPFYPRSPYAAAKIYAYWITINYRESYGMHASNGILFNHESPMRGNEFVTRKITVHFANMLCGNTEKPLELGNLDSKRDWGFAGDYVEMMWLMLQQKEPDTYIIATGKNHSIREFVENAGRVCGFDIEWRGKGIEEIGINKKTNQILVKVNQAFYRPAEVEALLGNPQKAQKELEWKPKVGFKELCEMMMNSDIERRKKSL